MQVLGIDLKTVSEWISSIVLYEVSSRWQVLNDGNLNSGLKQKP